ncbi:hypothetical protein ACSAMQ_16555, partial [Lysobacter sp. 1R34A]
SAPMHAPAAPAPATASDAVKPQLARERRYELREAAPAGAAAASAPKAEGRAEAEARTEARADRGSKSAPSLGNAVRSPAPAAAAQSANMQSANSAAADAQAAQPAVAQDSTVLERIEVTGSRVRLNATEEATLTPAQWLEIIRSYRDRGDIELARDSLRRFHRAHPQARVPDDLRALLK